MFIYVYNMLIIYTLKELLYLKTFIMVLSYKRR